MNIPIDILNDIYYTISNLRWAAGVLDEMNRRTNNQLYDDIKDMKRTADKAEIAYKKLEKL